MDHSSIPCKFFKVGHCKYGESCQFLHPPICSIPQCPKMSCPNRHPRQCKHHLKFGFCKFGDMCSFSHSTASPSLPISPPTCASNSKCDEIISELQTLKSTISTLSNQIFEYGSILSTLQKQYPFTTQITPITSDSSNNPPQQPPLTTTPSNNPQQKPNPKVPSSAPNLIALDKHQNQEFSCYQCNYQCHSESALKRHITIKHKNNTPAVSIPQKISSPPSNLSIVSNSHVAPSSHTRVLYSCNICTNVFPTGPSLSSHIVDAHMPLEEYHNLDEIECPHCLMQVTYHKESIMNHKSVCIIPECPKMKNECNPLCFYQEVQCPHCTMPVPWQKPLLEIHKSICTIPKCPQTYEVCKPKCYYQILAEQGN